MTPPPDRPKTIREEVAAEHRDVSVGRVTLPGAPAPKASPVASPAPPIRGADPSKTLPDWAPRVDTAPIPEPPRSVTPAGGIRVDSRWFQVRLPGAFVAALAALLGALASRLTIPEPKPRTAEQDALVAAERAACNERVGKVELQIAELRETQARTAGWLQGAFSKVGVQAPTAPGAEQVQVTSQPEPLGSRAPRRVVVETPIPAPAPRR